MCGIAGWFNTNPKQDDTDSAKITAVNVIERVLERQHHRGPDTRGLWVSPNHKAVFGHNRLAIVELSDAGAQPMVDSDSDWVVTYNGELYNYKKLRHILESKHQVHFKGNSDSEVFLYGVKVWGIDEFLRQADGMFAAGLYSTKTGRLFLVRDRAGEKPLYYTLQSNGLYFASELRPLVRSLGAKTCLSLSFPLATQ